MNHPAPLAALAGLLAQEIEAVQAVLDTLYREQGALNARDSESLLRIASEKASRVALAEELGAQRRKLAAGDSTAQSADRWRSSIGAGEIERRQQELKALAVRCRELNDANGLMIRWQRQRVQESLQIILGGGGDETTVYGPGGAKSASLYRRTPLASI